MASAHSFAQGSSQTDAGVNIRNDGQMAFANDDFVRKYMVGEKVPRLECYIEFLIRKLDGCGLPIGQGLRAGR